MLSTFNSFVLYGLVTVFVNVFVESDRIAFNDCGSTFQLLAVDIDGCDPSQPCRLAMGETRDIAMEFVVCGHAAKTMRHEVFIKIRNYYSGLLATPEDACSVIECTSSSSSGDPSSSIVRRFMATIDVNSTLANLQSTLYWRTYDIDRRLLICMKTPVMLMDPLDDEYPDMES